MPGSPDPPTLYEWAGGRAAFERLIEAFYDRVEGDELISPLFPGGVSREHRDHVVLWWSEVLGGPASCTERLGGYPRMLSKHRDLAITPEQRLRFATLMSLAADDAGLPADPEFRSAFIAYVEWGTRLALENSRPGAKPAPEAPVPRWSWGSRLPAGREPPDAPCPSRRWESSGARMGARAAGGASARRTTSTTTTASGGVRSTASPSCSSGSPWRRSSRGSHGSRSCASARASAAPSTAPDPGSRPAPETGSDIEPVTAESEAMAKALKRRGFVFVGPTTAYATMEAVGMVNDHLAGCAFR
jgi:hemoglobin